MLAFSDYSNNSRVLASIMWETVSSGFPQHAVKDMVHLWAFFLRVSMLGLMFMDPAGKDTTGLVWEHKFSSLSHYSYENGLHGYSSFPEVSRFSCSIFP